jgi:hypothetical protein
MLYHYILQYSLPMYKHSGFEIRISFYRTLSSTTLCTALADTVIRAVHRSSRLRRSPPQRAMVRGARDAMQ